MKLNEFTEYWNILKKNYQDKTHNTDDLKIYYSCFKDYSKEEFKGAIKNCLLYQCYFPRIDEIAKYLPKKPEKIFEEKDVEPLTEEDKKVIDDFLESVGD